MFVFCMYACIHVLVRVSRRDCSAQKWLSLVSVPYVQSRTSYDADVRMRVRALLLIDPDQYHFYPEERGARTFKVARGRL